MGIKDQMKPVLITWQVTWVNRKCVNQPLRSTSSKFSPSSDLKVTSSCFPERLSKVEKVELNVPSTTTDEGILSELLCWQLDEGSLVVNDKSNESWGKWNDELAEQDEKEDDSKDEFSLG